jgi:hypothetical protein
MKTSIAPGRADIWCNSSLLVPLFTVSFDTYGAVLLPQDTSINPIHTPVMHIPFSSSSQSSASHASADLMVDGLQRATLLSGKLSVTFLFSTGEG